MKVKGKSKGKIKGLSTILTTVIIVAAVILATAVSLLAFSEPVKDIKDKALNYISDVFGGLFRGGETGKAKEEMNFDGMPEGPEKEVVKADAENARTMMEHIQKTWKLIEQPSKTKTGNNFKVKNTVKLETRQPQINSAKLGIRSKAEPDFQTWLGIGDITLLSSPVTSEFKLSDYLVELMVYVEERKLVLDMSWKVNGYNPTFHMEFRIPEKIAIQIEKTIKEINQGIKINPDLPIGFDLQGFPIESGKYKFIVDAKLTGDKRDTPQVHISVYHLLDKEPIEVKVDDVDAKIVFVLRPEKLS